MATDKGGTQSAPGRPGRPSVWSPSGKDGVGTAIDAESTVWFTLYNGIVSEAYYPSLDQVCLHDLRLVAADGRGFVSEEERGAEHEISLLAPDVPAYRVISNCHERRYRIEKEVLVDPRYDVLLVKVRFEPLAGQRGDWHLYVIANPHLGVSGDDNSAWLAESKGTPLFLARGADYEMAMACSAPWLRRSVGFAGQSGGWEDLVAHGRMTWDYSRADGGNVILTGEVDLRACGGEFLLALGFGRDSAMAAFQARASLLDGFEPARDEYIRGWRSWLGRLEPAAPRAAHPSPRDLRGVSAAVIRAHEAKTFHGGIIAGLSIPWGEVRGDEERGGYHLIWTRDMTHAAGGLLAAGASEDALRAMRYMAVVQELDGGWFQCMRHDGTAAKMGLQLDEVALPILLVELLHERRVLDEHGLHRAWPMVRRAADFLLRHGPATPQDRWENSSGNASYTLAAEIAALAAASALADRAGETDAARRFRETADSWHARLDEWLYVTGTEFDRLAGVEGHYVRLASPRESGRRGSQGTNSVGVDALALVRFGLRAPDNPRIVNTVKVVDQFLRVETPHGASWHRYIGDLYGETADGSPPRGGGIGRLWPLLTGERAHYELAAGRVESAQALAAAMESFAGPTGLMPEQVWDSPDIPEKGLFLGRPTGSAMPLVWAHGEYLKLRRSLIEGRIFDLPMEAARRYVL